MSTWVVRTLLAVGLCAAAAQGALFTFEFPITVEQEVPSPTIPGLEGAGVGFVDYNSDSNLLSWEIPYAGLTSNLTNAHFHGAADYGFTAPPEVFIASAGGPLVTPLPQAGTLIGLTIISEAQEADLLAGLWYVNLHTTLNPAGEIRGQVIPEPATLALLGLGTLTFIRRRSR